MSIQSDSDFKAALDKLPTAAQRTLAARFVNSVAELCKDPRIQAAIHTAQRPDISDVELTVVYQAAKTASVETYAQCGKEGDWLNQAGHFVAEAAMSCVAPAKKGLNLAWDAAMDARMARTCATIAHGEGTQNKEADLQYRLLEEFKVN